MTHHVADFLIKLAEDAQALEAFRAAPETLLDDVGATPAERSAILSGDDAQIFSLYTPAPNNGPTVAKIWTGVGDGESPAVAKIWTGVGEDESPAAAKIWTGVDEGETPAVAKIWTGVDEEPAARRKCA
ncbi:MAG: hypothetical protein AB7H66_03335 [Hyphomonadaceae bacterium]